MTDHDARIPSKRFLSLGVAHRKELERIMLRGERPDLEALVGWEYCGLNIAFWAEYSPILKFIKGFYRTSEQVGTAMGYNIPVVQNGRNKPWLAEPSETTPKRFGFYQVAPVDAATRDNAYLHALLLDYSLGGNPFADPASRLRDYLVRVDPSTDDLLLGKATIAVGPMRIATNFFILERRRSAPGHARS